VFTTQKSVASLLLGGVDAVLIALVGLIVLAFYHPALLAFDLVLILGAALVLIPLGRGGTGTSVAESKAKYAVAGWLEEMARHPLSFKLAGGEQLAQSQIETLAKSYLDKRDRHFRIVFRQVVGALSIEVIASVALLAVGGFLVIERQLSIGQLVAAELIVTAVVASIAKLGGKVETFYDLVAAVDKLGEILDLPLERGDGELMPPGGCSGGGLLLDDVQVAPRPGIVPLRITLKVAPGERVVIAGGSEAETAAVVDSIFGLSLPSGGVIEVDGLRVRQPSRVQFGSYLGRGVGSTGSGWPRRGGESSSRGTASSNLERRGAAVPAPGDRAHDCKSAGWHAFGVDSRPHTGSNRHTDGRSHRRSPSSEPR
jgi:ABC-type bacteriocin/lantibiotic exporter with double-glycine peptidase domain